MEDVVSGLAKYKALLKEKNVVIATVDMKTGKGGKVKKAANPGAGVAALGFLAVLAAVMSTLDAQILTLGSMLSRDILRPSEDPKGDVRRGRAFGVVIAVAVFVLWRVGGQSIFSLASVSFSGYVTLTPALFLGLRWRRFNTAGALTSILGANAVYFLALEAAGGLGGAMSPAWFGYLPVMWGFLAGCAGAVLGTYLGGRRDAGVMPAAGT